MNLGYAKPRYPESMDKEAIKKNAFHDLNTLVVKIDDSRIGWAEREILNQIGEKLYGKRKQ